MSKKLAIAMFGQKRLSREGGVEIVVKELCTRMAQNGCDVTCYNRAGHHVSGAEYDDAGKTEYEGIRQKSVPTIEQRGLAAVSSSAFAALYSAFGKYDVVHIHAEGPAFFAWLPKMLGKRVVVGCIEEQHRNKEHVVNELDVPILCMGLKDVVVSASPEGILVSDKEQSSYIKPFVNTLDHRVMFAEKSWGSFKVIDIDKASMIIKVTLNAGHRMNYHSHQHRDEVWTVIAGEGKTVVDGMEQNVKAGDVITMSAGCRHTIIAETELKLIEVQLGEAIDVHDKQKFELEY